MVKYYTNHMSSCICHEVCGAHAEGVFLFNIVVFRLVNDFVFSNVCFDYQNSTGNGS